MFFLGIKRFTERTSKSVGKGGNCARALSHATIFPVTKRVSEQTLSQVTVNNNSPIQDYVHPDDQTQPTFEMTPGFKPFTEPTLFQKERSVNLLMTNQYISLREKNV